MQNNKLSLLSKTMPAKIGLALLLTLFILLFSLLTPLAAFAADGNNGDYQVIIEDGADLFTDAEEAALRKQLEGILPYGSAAIITNDEYNSDASALAEQRFRELFLNHSATLLMIDMYNRRIQIFSDGAIYRSISRAKANEITDNIYTYATKGDYYTAAQKTFEQIETILGGGRITTPMKYATNAAFAIGIVLIINFIIITAQRKKKNVTTLTNALAYEGGRGRISAVQSVNAVMTSQRKTRHVESSGGSSGGGGGGFSGGGGGGGGFSSGGGGGHSF